MDKEGFFQAVYESQFALGKKTGACLSAQYLALEAFLKRSPDWHYQWWPIIGITPAAWLLLRDRFGKSTKSAKAPTRGLIRAHLYDRVTRGRVLFERPQPLKHAWHFYESRDATILALIAERDSVADIDWLTLDPEIFGQQSSALPMITVKRFNAMAAALQPKAA